jgi:hypothetical protein
MHPHVFLPLLATIVSFLFAVVVFDQYILRPRPYKAARTAGLLLFGIGTFAQFWGAQGGWTEPVYKLWYISGAFCVAALLGMGTAYLFLPRRIAHLILAALVVALAAAATRVILAPVDLAALPTSADVHVTGRALPADVRGMTPFFNVLGAGALIAGALYSVVLVARERRAASRIISNVLIAAGALSASLGTGLSRFDITWGESLSQLLAVLLIFAGFLISIDVFHQFRVPFTRIVLGSRR